MYRAFLGSGRYALEGPAIGVVASIGRRRLGLSHPKLREVVRQDFADCSALAEVLSGQDAAAFAWVPIPAWCRMQNSVP